MTVSKQKKQTQPPANGFTLIELIVVISLFVILATFVIANYNGTRGSRNLKIAENQMVTNIRKAQSYILSARNVGVGNSNPAKFYALQFNKNTAQYNIQSIDTSYNLNSAFETLKLPDGITISNIQIVYADGTTISPNTVQVAYSAPYAKVYVYTSADCLSQGSFLAAMQSPSCLLTLTDRKIIITLQITGTSTTRTVSIYGVTGKVESGP